jgi:hypothetical protein
MGEPAGSSVDDAAALLATTDGVRRCHEILVHRRS